MNIANDIKCIGVNDREIRLFEAQFTTPNGMAYNSYAIIDEKLAVIDGVEKAVDKGGNIINQHVVSSCVYYVPSTTSATPAASST